MEKWYDNPLMAFKYMSFDIVVITLIIVNIPILFNCQMNAAITDHQYASTFFSSTCKKCKKPKGFTMKASCAPYKGCKN